MPKPTDFAYCLTRYLSIYLPGTIGASPNTISSYKDTFKLFLIFASESKKVKPEKITLDTISKGFVINFLDWIENERNCSIQTRNQRLTAFHG
jgi:integrase/recombinase XerD